MLRHALPQIVFAFIMLRHALLDSLIALRGAHIYYTIVVDISIHVDHMNSS